MVWESASPNAGFTSLEPWLPIPAEHRPRAVDAQDTVQGSLLNHYRRFLAFRRTCRPLVKGDIEFLRAEGPVVAFTRRHGNETVYCAFNMSPHEQTIPRPDGRIIPFEETGFSGQLRDSEIALSTYDAFLARIE